MNTLTVHKMVDPTNSYLTARHLQSHYELFNPRHPKSYVVSLRASGQEIYMDRERCCAVMGFHG
jgi:hypothetical protein